MKTLNFELQDDLVKMLEEWLQMVRGDQEYNPERISQIESYMTGVFAAKLESSIQQEKWAK